MSFFNPLNPALQRELGSLAYDRASVFPGLSEVDEDQEASMSEEDDYSQLQWSEVESKGNK